jgi:hypothetical protein
MLEPENRSSTTDGHGWTRIIKVFKGLLRFTQWVND